MAVPPAATAPIIPPAASPTPPPAASKPNNPATPKVDRCVCLTKMCNAIQQGAQYGIANPLISLGKRISDCVKDCLYVAAKRLGFIWAADKAHSLAKEVFSALSNAYNETMGIFLFEDFGRLDYRQPQLSLEDINERLTNLTTRVTKLKIEKLEDASSLSNLDEGISGLEGDLQRAGSGPLREHADKTLAALKEAFKKCKTDASATLFALFYSSQNALLTTLQGMNKDGGAKKSADLDPYRQYLKAARILETAKMVDLAKNAKHQEIKAAGKLLMIPFADQTRLPNLGNTCWMNGALQALMAYSKEILACQEPVKEQIREKLFDSNRHAIKVETLKALQNVVRAFGSDEDDLKSALLAFLRVFETNPDLSDENRRAIRNGGQEDARFLLQIAMRLFQQHHYQHLEIEPKGKDRVFTPEPNPHPAISVKLPQTKEERAKEQSIAKLINGDLHQILNDPKNLWKGHAERAQHTILTTNQNAAKLEDTMPPPELLVVEFERVIPHFKTSDEKCARVISLIQQQHKSIAEILGKNENEFDDGVAKAAAQHYFERDRQEKNDVVLLFPKEGKIHLSVSGSQKPLTTYQIKAFTYHSGNGNGGHWMTCREGSDAVWRSYSDEAEPQTLSQRELEEKFAKVTHIFTRRVVEGSGAADVKTRDNSEKSRGPTMDTLGTARPPTPPQKSATTAATTVAAAAS